MSCNSIIRSDFFYVRKNIAYYAIFCLTIVYCAIIIKVLFCHSEIYPFGRGAAFLKILSSSPNCEALIFGDAEGVATRLFLFPAPSPIQSAPFCHVERSRNISDSSTMLGMTSAITKPVPLCHATRSCSVMQSAPSVMLSEAETSPFPRLRSE